MVSLALEYYSHVHLREKLRLPCKFPSFLACLFPLPRESICLLYDAWWGCGGGVYIVVFLERIQYCYRRVLHRRKHNTHFPVPLQNPQSTGKTQNPRKISPYHMHATPWGLPLRSRKDIGRRVRLPTCQSIDSSPTSWSSSSWEQILYVSGSYGSISDFTDFAVKNHYHSRSFHLIVIVRVMWVILWPRGC